MTHTTIIQVLKKALIQLINQRKIKISKVQDFLLFGPVTKPPNHYYLSSETPRHWTQIKNNPDTRLEKIVWETSPKVKEVLNEITIGNKPSLVSEAKDARISLSLSGLLISDTEVSDINFSHSVSKQVIYLMGIASNEVELDKVIYHARTVKGVKKVISHIIIKNDKRRL